MSNIRARWLDDEVHGGPAVNEPGDETVSPYLAAHILADHGDSVPIDRYSRDVAYASDFDAAYASWEAWFRRYLRRRR